MSIDSFYDLVQIAQQPQAPGLFDSMVPIIAIFVIMWVLMIRPQQKKQRELATKISSLKTGDRVVTTGGVHGTVTNVKEGSTLTLKVDENCKLTVDKIAIAVVIPKEAKEA
jgi:preprotein translocase subunit YajC